MNKEIMFGDIEIEKLQIPIFRKDMILIQNLF